ncbi:MAG: hypothetical protein JWP95_2008 [Actinotalea sp.]|nr:hypothetical protein [Actinotalea sp.]
MRRSISLRLSSVCALVVAVGVVSGIGSASADTAPVDPSVPTTVSVDPLPTAQINGVVWKQEIVGNTVYVGGNFTTARPAGSAPGTNEVNRSYLLAYNLTTGVLLPFAPTLNGQVRDFAVSPDGSTLYVAGEFTVVNGQNRYRAAAFSVATGELTAFRPTVNAKVSAISAFGDTVFLGGSMGVVNGVGRSRAAAVNAGDGLTTRAFAPAVADGGVLAMAIAPNGQSVVIGGSFTSVNGSNNPGFGLTRLDATTGATWPQGLPVNAEARNGGTSSAILSLESDGTKFYGAGYHFGPGNVEGVFAADWATGSLAWIEDCHGDTYAAAPAGNAVYAASHKHYCGNNGSFPQTTPWTFHRGTAMTKVATRTATQDYLGYPDHRGKPSPTILNWFPEINAGTFTGQTQGPWTVTGNDSYVLFGGEFTQVSGVNQQGIVRFALPTIAPNDEGPRLTTAQFPLVATPDGAGSVRLNWRSNDDPDNETLTYRVYREDQPTTAIHTATMTTEFWQPQAMTYRAVGQPTGARRYRVVVTDPFNNSVTSPWASVSVTGTGTPSTYARTVLDDAPIAYWRLGEASGTAVGDTTGFHQATASGGVSRGAAGALANDGNTASTFNGSTSAYASTGVIGNAQDSVSVEAWVRTTTTQGGKIVGFSGSQSGTSGIADRHLYMDNLGRLHFGIQSATLQTINSTLPYNNGQWHHVVGTYGSNTMRLYVDGALVSQRSDILNTRAYWGYWRIGGDRLSGWPSRPTSDYINATLDEVAVYNTVLPATSVSAHWAARTGTAVNQAPVASFTASSSGLTASFDGRGSSDPDGTVVSHAWSFGDTTSGSGSTTSHAYAQAGTYTVTLTVTDDKGATGTTSQSVTVSAPPGPGDDVARDAFGRAVTSGWGSAEVGGAWTSTGTATRFSVDGARGLHTVTAGTTVVSSLDAVSSTTHEMAVILTADKVPVGGSVWINLQARRAAPTNYYGVRVALQADGSVVLMYTTVNGAPRDGGTALPPGSFSAGDRIAVRVQVEGASPTVVRAKAWEVGSPEPAGWQPRTTTSSSDSTAGLQGPGSVGISTYLATPVTNGPLVVGFDDLSVGPLD